MNWERNSRTTGLIRSGSAVRPFLRVLVVEDSEEEAHLIANELRQSGYSPACRRVDTPDALTDSLAQDQWDLVISDSTMPGFSGAAALAIFKKCGLEIPFLFVSGTLSTEAAAAAMKVGVRECIPKGNLARLGPAVEGELRDFRGRRTRGVREAAGDRKDGPAESDLREQNGRGSDGDRRQAETVTGASAKPVVLLVDDHEDNLVALEALLAEPGISLVKATSGREALSLALEKDFALILLDVRMPDMDGLEVAELLHEREKSRSVPVIFLTACPDNREEISRGYAAGAVDYIAKPVVPEHLKAKVSFFLELYRKNALLVEQKARLGELARELEAFNSTVAHDLRAPLRAMHGLSRSLLDNHGGEFAEGARRQLSRIETAAGRMDTLIQDLLSYARLGQSPLELGTIDLDRVVSQVLASLNESSTGQVIVENKLGSAKGFEICVVQALNNLVLNALKYTAPGVNPKVLIRKEARKGRIRLWVEDNGIGIAREHHERIFRSFERLHRQEEYPGTGLGLAIVRKVMERMNGSVGLESELGKGSRFWIELPPA